MKAVTIRIAAIAGLCLFFTACAGPKKLKPANSLSGVWLPQSQEIGGTALPGAAFQNQRLVIEDTAYTVIAESTDKGLINVNGNKIDIYGKEGVNKGKHFTAIYTLEGGILTICYNLAGTGYPEAFSTTGKPMYFLSVFKKEVSN